MVLRIVTWHQPYLSCLTSILIVIGYFAGISSGSHFRGAHFTWELSQNNIPFQIELNFRIAWRRDYSERTACDAETINSGILLGPADAGYILCKTNCDFRVGNLDFKCTDFSLTEGWTSGLGSHLVNFTEPGYYELSWIGRSWLQEVTRGQNEDWEFLIGVDITPRSDTGLSNSSPKSAIGTILRIQEGCNQSVFIPVSDPENDPVICRWSTGRECGGICGPPVGFMLHRETCRLDFLPGATTGLYALALQIEDFLASDISRSNPLSSVPLQFIVQIYSNTITSPESNVPILNCDLQPRFISPTPEDGQCFGIRLDVKYTIQIVARTKDQYTSIREINTVSSIGMTKTGVEWYEEPSTDYYVNITWLPETGQLGDSIFCFVALDSIGISSNQRCIYISTFLSSPLATSVSYRESQHALVIEFDQQIQMPTTGSPKVKILDKETDEIVASLDSSDSEVSSYTNTSLIINVPEGILFSGPYYVQLDEGVVNGHQLCGPKSIAVQNTSHLVLLLPATQAISSTNAPVLPTNSPSRDSTAKEYMWLIILVVVVVVFFILLIIIIVIIRWKVTHDKSGEYARQKRQEEYLRTMQGQTKIVGYDGPYAPNFHDIEVKFR